MSAGYGRRRNLSRRCQIERNFREAEWSEFDADRSFQRFNRAGFGQHTEVTMLKRYGFVSLLVFGLAAVSSDASAFYKIPAIAGVPGNVIRMGGIYWEFRGDGYVRRTNSTLGGSALEWVIPLPFHQLVPAQGNDWSVQVWVSHDTACSLQWTPNDLPTPAVDGTVRTSRDLLGMPTDGLLDLTGLDRNGQSLCPLPGSGSQAVGCVTGYSTAFVSCLVQGGIAQGGSTDRPPGFVGAVTYTINAHQP